MSTFDPVTLFYILYETMGAWLWVLLATALALLVGILSAVVKFRRARCPAARPLWIAVAAGLIAAVGLTFAVPIWSSGRSWRAERIGGLRRSVLNRSRTRRHRGSAGLYRGGAPMQCAHRILTCAHS